MDCVWLYHYQPVIFTTPFIRTPFWCWFIFIKFNGKTVIWMWVSRGSPVHGSPFILKLFMKIHYFFLKSRREKQGEKLINLYQNYFQRWTVNHEPLMKQNQRKTTQNMGIHRKSQRWTRHEPIKMNRTIMNQTGMKRHNESKFEWKTNKWNTNEWKYANESKH